MREILFRGKKTGFDDWVQGFITSPCEKSMCTLKQTSPNVEWYVDAETVGQYTDVIDKNGVNMCEGDIVAGAVHWLDQKKNGIVTYRDGSFGLLWYRGEVEQFNAFTSMCNIEYEVIGNIHDNPELMKEGTE